MQQITDDRLGFDLLIDPALAGRTPRRFADVELLGLRLQIPFAFAERSFLRRGPFGERLLLGSEVIALRLEELSHLVDFVALLDQGVAQAAVVSGELFLSLIESLLSDIDTAGLSHLCPRFFDRHSHFECRAMRLFQFGAQLVESFAATFKIVRVQREHVLLSSQIGELTPSFTFPIVSFAFDLLSVVFDELFEGSLRLEEHLSLAIDRAFAFFEQ